MELSGTTSTCPKYGSKAASTALQSNPTNLSPAARKPRLHNQPNRNRTRRPPRHRSRLERSKLIDKRQPLNPPWSAFAMLRNLLNRELRAENPGRFLL